MTKNTKIQELLDIIETALLSNGHESFGGDHANELLIMGDAQEAENLIVSVRAVAK